MSEERKINLNDVVRVKLTPEGEQQLWQHFSDLFGDKKTTAATAFAQRNARGEFQLWDLMHIFGPRCFMGHAPMFEGNIIITNPEDRKHDE